MDNEQRLASVRQYFTDIWSEGNLVVVDEILSENFTFEMTIMTMNNREAFKELVSANRKAFENLTYTPQEMVVADDVVAVRWEMSAKHVGEWSGIPGTNRDVLIIGMSFFYFEGDKMIKVRVLSDLFGLRQQLGVAA